MTKPGRIGLVGTGHWASRFHAAGAQASRWDLVSVWGRDAEAAARVAEAEGLTLATLDFEQFLDSVDAVTFAVPPHVQAPLALAAIEAGKHVLLEKPIAVDLEQANALVEAAERTGVATVVLFTMLFDPRVRAIVDTAEADAWRGGNGL